MLLGNIASDYEQTVDDCTDQEERIARNLKFDFRNAKVNDFRIGDSEAGCGWQGWAFEDCTEKMKNRLVSLGILF